MSFACLFSQCAGVSALLRVCAGDSLHVQKQQALDATLAEENKILEREKAQKTLAALDSFTNMFGAVPKGPAKKFDESFNGY